MGLDMYLGKINKKALSNKELDMLCSINGNLENILEQKKLIDELNIEALVKKVFIESFYNDYMKLRDASKDILKQEYVEKYSFGVRRTNKDRLEYIKEQIRLHCEDIDKKYEYYINNKEKVDSLCLGELGYFRKHSDLHGYFEDLYTERGGTEEFNCVKLILSKEDIEKVIEIADSELNGENVVPESRGFFWGESSKYDWEETKKVFSEILETTDFETETVYYDSWW